MKTKHFGRYLIALFLSLCALSSLALPVFASVGDPNIAGGSQGGWGDVVDGYFWYSGEDGVRVTVVDAVTGEIKSISVDYTNIEPNVQVHFGKVCKTRYAKQGQGLSKVPNAASPYTYLSPKISLPRIIEGDIDQVRDYFTRTDVVKMIAGDTGFEFEELIGGAYKLLIEPIGYFTSAGIRYAATATEAAMLAKSRDEMVLHQLRPFANLNLPLAIYLEKPDLGYNSGDSVATRPHPDSGNPYYTNDDIISTLGIGIIKFKEEVNIYYHVYTSVREIPEGYTIDELEALPLEEQMQLGEELPQSGWKCVKDRNLSNDDESLVKDAEGTIRYYPYKDKTFQQIPELIESTLIGDERMMKTVGKVDVYPIADVEAQYPTSGLQMSSSEPYAPSVLTPLGNPSALVYKTGKEFHTASIRIQWTAAPVKIFYHTITFTMNPDGSVKESEWSESSNAIATPTYRPGGDPNCTGNVVGLLGYDAPGAIEDDHREEYPQRGKNNASPVQRYPSGDIDFSVPDIPAISPNATIYVSLKKITEIHVAIVIVQPDNPPVIEEATDRIKTFDVTQFIDQTLAAVQGSDHLIKLTDKPETSYNNSNMPKHSSHISNVNKSAFMQSKPLTFTENKKVQALNYVNANGEVACSSQSHDSHTVSGSHSSSCPTVCTNSHSYPTGGYSGDAIYQMDCRYTQENVVHYFGLNPAVTQAYKDTNGKLVVNGGYKTAAQLANSSQFTEVGFVIHKDYYADPDVVKLSGSHQYSGSKQEFLLPNKNGMPAQADEHAVYDVLLNGDKYWVRYFAGTNIIGSDRQQSSKQENVDKKEDYSSQIAHLNFAYTEGNNKIDGAQYIAHRDLLSGDQVMGSLAVSGYMAKYANNSQTYDYLKFMESAGFAQKGLQGTTIPARLGIKFTTDAEKISHENRTVWIANAALREQLKASADGKQKDEYNTEYVGGKSEAYLTEKTHVRFGLGGLSADAVNLYSKYLTNSTEISDNTLKTVNVPTGDALRSVWYTTQHSKGDSIAQCASQYSSSGHSLSCSHCSESHSCSWSPVHSGANICHKDWTSVTNNKYVLKDVDTHLKNGKYTGKAVFDKTQTDMFLDIYTSRTTFRVPLAIEGTTNGERDASGANGLKFNTELLKLKDNQYLAHKTFKDDNYTHPKYGTSMDFMTLDVQTYDLANTGAANPTNQKEHVHAEYIFSIPTEDFRFNPSVAMAFDDDFRDVNKSVWMLSEQPREVHFKNMLDVRLTVNATDNSTGSGAGSGYPTTISSEWSTDKSDMDVQNETNLPTMKASSAYSTETSTVGGTITAYVVLQDPEFAANPDEIKAKNEETMRQYNEQMEMIRSQIAGAVDNPSEASKTGNKDIFGLAMYTNMANGASLNSSFSKVPYTTADALPDKEPMILKDSTVMSAVVTSGNPNKSRNDADIHTPISNSSWNYYALSGERVLNLYGYRDGDASLDISDTTSEGMRKILADEKKVQNQKEARAHQKTRLNELNAYLCELLFKQGDTVSAPNGTKPFLNGNQEFVWYNEDYEGFVVAVLEIEFAIGGDKGDITRVNADGHAKTDFHSVYQHESDWRAATNDSVLIDNTDGRVLAYNIGAVALDFNISNGTAAEVTLGKDAKCFLFESPMTPKMSLLTEKSADIIQGWSKELNNYEPGIYGIGLELANLHIKFGVPNDNTDNKIIENDSGAWSFFYQPTYYNIRGSVFDTAR